MGKIGVYNFVTANGCFKGPNEDISWAHQLASKETEEFAAESSQSGTLLLFGRKTYEMMMSYWPTEEAKKNAPEVAESMNKAEKIVFSKTLKKSGWNNTRILNGNLGNEVRKLKETSKNDITILGSGRIVNQLTDEGLIDSYQLMVYPIAIGNGVPFLHEISKKFELELTNSRSFKSGQVLLTYQRGKG
jgi:dihydrofolate reductase